MMRKDDSKDEDKEYRVKQISKIIKDVKYFAETEIIGSEISEAMIAGLNDLINFRKNSRSKQTSSFTQSNINRLLASLDRLKSFIEDSDLPNNENFLANKILDFALTSLERRLNKFKKDYEAEESVFKRIKELRDTPQQKSSAQVLEMEIDVPELVQESKEEVDDETAYNEPSLAFFSSSSEFKRIQIIGSGNFANCYIYQVFGEAKEKLESMGFCGWDGYIIVKEARPGRKLDTQEGVIGEALFKVSKDKQIDLVNPVINIKFDNQPMIISRREANKDAIHYLTQQHYKWVKQVKQPAVLAAQLINFFQMTYDGMQFMHANGYLHLDIGLRNILVNADGKFLLADFGLAALKNTSSNDVFTQTTTRGPIRWIDAHRANKNKASMASDLFSLKIAFMEAFAVAASRDVRDIFPYELKELEEKRKEGFLSDETYLSQTLGKLKTYIGSEENRLVPDEIYEVFTKVEFFLNSFFSMKEGISQEDLEESMLEEQIAFNNAIDELKALEWYQSVEKMDLKQVVADIEETTQSPGILDDYNQDRLPAEAKEALKKLGLFSPNLPSEEKGVEQENKSDLTQRHSNS